MASILALAGGAIINSLAFSGSNFLFSKFSDHGSAERVRHDQAVEQIQKEQIKYAKDRQKRLDFINEELQRTFSDVDDAMEAYFVATQMLTMQWRLTSWQPRKNYRNYNHLMHYQTFIIHQSSKKTEKLHSF